MPTCISLLFSAWRVPLSDCSLLCKLFICCSNFLLCLHGVAHLQRF